MKVYDTPQQARSLREIEANMLDSASQKLTQIHGTVQPVQAAEENTATEIKEEAQAQETPKKPRKKKDSKGV